MALTEVPPPMRPTLKVVRGAPGTSNSATARDRAAERVDRVGRAEGAVAVAARAREGDLVAPAADADVGDVEPAPSIDTKASIPRQLLSNRWRAPRMSPRPSSPTVAAKVTVPAVWITGSASGGPRRSARRGRGVVADARSLERCRSATRGRRCLRGTRCRDAR